MPMTAFVPSINGFHFNNTFSSEDITGELFSLPSWMVPDDTWFLCGGMCFAALDRFFQRKAIPDMTTPPGKGTPLLHELVYRQIASVESVGWEKILNYQNRPDEGHWYEPQHSLGHLSQSEQWPGIRDKIDSGIPTTVCLIRASRAAVWKIGDNHQVIAYGYSINSNKVTLNVYDPNSRDQDDIVVGFCLGQEGSRLDAYQTRGPDPRGFLRTPYDRAEVVIAQAPALEAQEDKLEWIWTVLS